MAITNREELVEQIALMGLTGLARQGDLDSLFESGTAPSPATPSTAGVVKQNAAVANLAAQTAINAIVTKLNALLAAERVSGQLAT